MTHQTDLDLVERDAAVGAMCARHYVSLKEASVLADLPEPRVRKDIETGVLRDPIVIRISDSRLCISWQSIFILAAVYANHSLPGGMRKMAFSKIVSIDATRHAWERENYSVRNTNCFNFYSNRYSRREMSHLLTMKVELDKYIELKVGDVVEDIAPRVQLYVDGLSKVRESDDILGGSAVFSGTRTSVCHIGKMAESPENINDILEDYPFLTHKDLEFAKLYYRAHPSVGRPRAVMEE